MLYVFGCFKGIVFVFCSFIEYLFKFFFWEKWFVVDVDLVDDVFGGFFDYY